MSFLFSIFWAVLTLAGPPADGRFVPVAHHVIHHGSGGAHVMDSNAGGPT